MAKDYSLSNLMDAYKRSKNDSSAEKQETLDEARMLAYLVKKLKTEFESHTDDSARLQSVEIEVSSGLVSRFLSVAQRKEFSTGYTYEEKRVEDNDNVIYVIRERVVSGF